MNVCGTVVIVILQVTIENRYQFLTLSVRAKLEIACE